MWQSSPAAIQAAIPHEQWAEPLQRAAGMVRLDVARRGGRSRIAVLRQQGCMKLRFPREAGLQAVGVNCSGGIAAGDRLHGVFTCAAGTELLLTAQAAERCYRARPGEASSVVSTQVRLAAASRLDWLPQEMILFDGARLRRRLEVEMAADARFLGLESRVFGRALHGERLRTLDLSDRILIRREGRPVLVDAFELHGDAEAALGRAAVGAGAVAAATIVLVAPDAEALLAPVRAVLSGDSGASAWNGLLRVGIVSRDAAGHRALLMAVLSVLRGGKPLPSVWRC